MDEFDRPAFLVHAHDLARRPRGQIGHQAFRLLGADVAPSFAQYHSDITHMTQTQTGTIGPKGPAALSCMGSGNLGALVLLVRYMGHEIFQRFILYGLPGPGDRKDKAPAACGIGAVPLLDHPDVVLGAIGRIPADNHQLRPMRWDKLADHVAKQRIFAAIADVALGHNEPKAYRHAIAVPRRHQQHEAQAEKPGLMLAGAPLLRHRIFGPAFVGVAAVAK
jgi:hypothetical protein